jgi:undecaprenyl-diphosphatase
MINELVTISIWLIGIGFLMIFLGLLHQIPLVNLWDKGMLSWIYTRLRKQTGFFQFIWPLGTTPVGVILILIIFLASWQIGLIVGLIYLISAFVERVIKFKVRRERPFETLSNVEMKQPKNPKDPSHPSGDSMRVWFLALIFPLAFGLSWPVLVFTSLIAISLSLGRIVLGVHYPLDVAGGTGLGLLATGITLIISQLAIIY